MNHTRNVSLPLAPDELRAFFENKNTLFQVDYSKCSLKGKIAIAYLSNLELQVAFDFSNSSTNDKLELIKEYFTIGHIVSSPTLLTAALQVILTAKEVGCEFLPEPMVMSPTEINEFITTNRSLVDRWILFLDSTLLYLPYCVEELRGALDLERSYEIIDDIHFVGQNIVNLLSFPHFMAIYHSGRPATELKFFRQQFTEYMFKGKNLYHYFSTDSNDLLQLLTGLLNQDVTFAELDQAIKSIQD